MGGWPTSVGHKRKARPCGGISASPPESGQWTDIPRGPFSANRRHALDYSTTSSAVASNLSGTVIPSALAVLRLITSSNLVGS